VAAEASEFTDEATVLIAAERRPATTRPATPGGKWETIKVG
jgi:hypothetical protein